MNRLLNRLIHVDWFQIVLFGLMVLTIGFVASTIYKVNIAEEKKRLNQEVVTFTIRCAGIPDQSVNGTSIHSDIVGSDMIHVYSSNTLVGMYPQTCTVSAE